MFKHLIHDNLMLSFKLFFLKLNAIVIDWSFTGKRIHQHSSRTVNFLHHNSPNLIAYNSSIVGVTVSPIIDSTPSDSIHSGLIRSNRSSIDSRLSISLIKVVRQNRKSIGLWRHFLIIDTVAIKLLHVFQIAYISIPLKLFKNVKIIMSLLSFLACKRVGLCNNIRIPIVVISLRIEIVKLLRRNILTAQLCDCRLNECRIVKRIMSTMVNISH